VQIHPSAIIEEGATLAEDVIVGPFTIIHANVSLGAGSFVESHCVLGRTERGRDPLPLEIGADATIRSHTVIYGGSKIGMGLQTGHSATIREHSTIGDRCRIGTQADIEGSVQIGDYVSIHSSVFIAPDARIGNYVWLFPYVVLTNDPHPPSSESQGILISDYAAVAANAVIMPGIVIGLDSLVAAGALVTRDVAPRTAVAGSPARLVGPASDIRLRSDGTAAYPWRRHFRSGYPDVVVDRWSVEFPDSSG